jgi:hypothetical protein
MTTLLAWTAGVAIGFLLGRLHEMRAQAVRLAERAARGETRH